MSLDEPVRVQPSTTTKVSMDDLEHYLFALDPTQLPRPSEDRGRTLLDARALDVARYAVSLRDGRREIAEGAIETPFFSDILKMGGAEDLSCLAKATTWEIWSAMYPVGAIGNMTARIVLVHERSIAEVLPALQREFQRLRNQMLAGRIDWLYSRHPGAVDLRNERDLIEDAFGISAEPRTLDDYAAGLLRRARRGLPEHETGVPEWFVEPPMFDSSGVAIPATESMRSFLDDRRAPSRLGVLLGEGGGGKTTLLRRLAFDYTARKAGARAVLYVGPKSAQWTLGEPLSIDRVIEKAIRAEGLGIDLTQFEALVATGSLLFVFDAFDEILASGREADDVVRKLLSLCAGRHTRVRVFLSARERWWNRLEPWQREAFTEFHIAPFGAEQIDEYLHRRLPTESDRRRASSALTHAGSGKRALPMLLDFVCEGIEEQGSFPEFQFDELNPGYSLALAVCRREAGKLGLGWNEQLQLQVLSTCIARAGAFFSDDDLREAALHIRHTSPTGTERQALRAHALLQKPNDRWTFRHDELAESILAQHLVEYLLGMPGVQPTSISRREEESGRVEALLVACHATYPGATSRAAALLQAHLSTQLDVAGSRIWGLADTQHFSSGARSSLLRILCLASSGGKGDRPVPRFLPRVRGARVIRGFLFQGSLSDLDLRGVRFENVNFHSASIYNCLFDEQSAFVQCQLVDCDIGRDCAGITTAEFKGVTADNHTRSHYYRHTFQALPGGSPGEAVLIDALRAIVSREQTFTGPVGNHLWRIIMSRGLQDGLLTRENGRLVVQPELQGEVEEAIVHHRLSPRLQSLAERVGHSYSGGAWN